MITKEQRIQIAELYRERGECRFDEPMAPHTSFHIGGPAEVYLVPADAQQTAETVALLAKLQIRCTLLGNGSNVLVSDGGIRGAVVRFEDKPGKMTFTELSDGSTEAWVSAGTSLSGFAREACDRGLAGMESATGIPGTVGGGIVMNAGAYGGEIRDSLVRATVLTKEGEILTLSPEELKLSYRYSVIPERGYIVLDDDPDFGFAPGPFFGERSVRNLGDKFCIGHVYVVFIIESNQSAILIIFQQIP